MAAEQSRQGPCAFGPRFFTDLEPHVTDRDREHILIRCCNIIALLEVKETEISQWDVLDSFSFSFLKLKKRYTDSLYGISLRRNDLECLKITIC